MGWIKELLGKAENQFQEWRRVKHLWRSLGSRTEVPDGFLGTLLLKQMLPSYLYVFECVYPCIKIQRRRGRVC